MGHTISSRIFFEILSISTFIPQLINIAYTKKTKVCEENGQKKNKIVQNSIRNLFLYRREPSVAQKRELYF